MTVFNWLEYEGLRDEKQRVAASVKHQVLCDATAIVGVCKQENKTTGEVQESTIEFGKLMLEEEPDYDDEINMYDRDCSDDDEEDEASNSNSSMGGCLNEDGDACDWEEEEAVLMKQEKE